MKRIALILGILVVLAGGTYATLRYLKYYQEPAPEAVDFHEVVKNSEEANPPETSNENLENNELENNEAESQPEVPPSLNLKMAFYAQAPFGNWDYPWQEACEEASVLLVANAYFNHEWTKEEFNEEILKLVEWEKERFGDYKHTDVEQTAEILHDYLDLQTVIHENPSYEDIQNILAKGHFIVMPFAGKLLHNPNFKNGGPIYHVLVVKGYKEGRKIVTNDVGTRKGGDYIYSWSVVDNALHDYEEPIQDGAKKFIEVLPPENVPEPESDAAVFAE